MSVREEWAPGDAAYFEYHCLESPESGDAPAWYHSHQRVTVLKESTSDGFLSTFAERAEAGEPKVYRVRFPDGLEWDAFEDELTTSELDYYRPDPPSIPRSSKVAGEAVTP